MDPLKLLLVSGQGQVETVVYSHQGRYSRQLERGPSFFFFFYQYTSSYKDAANISACVSQKKYSSLGIVPNLCISPLSNLSRNYALLTSIFFMSIGGIGTPVLKKWCSRFTLVLQGKPCKLYALLFFLLSHRPYRNNQFFVKKNRQSLTTLLGLCRKPIHARCNVVYQGAWNVMERAFHT